MHQMGGQSPAEDSRGVTQSRNYVVLSQFIEDEAEQLLRTLSVYVYYAGLGQGAVARDVAYEVLNDVVVEALVHAERFDPTRSPRAWLLGIAANIIRRRKTLAHKRAAEVPIQAAAPPGEQRLSDDEIWDLLVAAPTDVAEEATARDTVRYMLNLVSSADRRVLELAKLHGFDGHALAHVLGVAQGTARVQLYRAVSRLRAAWHKQDQGSK